MKIILILLTFIFSFKVYSQTDTLSPDSTCVNLYVNPSWSVYPSSIVGHYSIGENYIPYVVGSNKIPGYEVEMRICSKDSTSVLSNGKRVAGLNCLIYEKNEYAGGEMTFKNDTTVIKDVKLIPIEDGALFTVIGEDFSMSFTLRTGIILKYENEYAIFNTINKGIWGIRKKS